VATQPYGQTCSVDNGSGTIAAADVTNVTVVCTGQLYRVGGTVSGLLGNGLVLHLSTGEDLPVAAGGSFTFSAQLADSSPYTVSVMQQPASPSQTCAVSNGSGIVAGADVQDVQVQCAVNYALHVMVSDNRNYALPGDVLDYAVLVGNDGSEAAGQVSVEAALPPPLVAANAVWSCLSASPGVCMQASGTGAPGATLNLPAGYSSLLLVSVPIGAAEGVYDLAVTAISALPGFPATGHDTTVLAMFKDGFDGAAGQLPPVIVGSVLAPGTLAQVTAAADGMRLRTAFIGSDARGPLFRLQFVDFGEATYARLVVRGTQGPLIGAWQPWQHDDVLVGVDFTSATDGTRRVRVIGGPDWIEATLPDATGAIDVHLVEARAVQ